jgi:hypothetical protein
MMKAVPDGKIEVVRFIQGLTAERPELLRPLDHQSWAKLLVMLLWFFACVWAGAWSPLIAGLPVFLLMGVLHYHMIVAIHEASTGLCSRATGRMTPPVLMAASRWRISTAEEASPEPSPALRPGRSR